ncbi:MAG: FAD-binding oxidoreductase [Saccharospirillaceae bacterium]|nr:FAD-binding oxidoreductase [Pseudomonadales bacterium]NRB79422.1 FAD-binding oxidoreductase [Saccharospirillaceae bacterium]
MAIISEDKINTFKKNIAGTVVLPNDNNYDELRVVWNAMIDRKPSFIVQCATAEDVAPCIAFARKFDLEITIRGAGHNIGGSAVSDGGLMIDFSAMKSITVDVKSNRAVVQPGATLGDFDAAVQVHGLATPVGINSTTGIAGLTIGGGFGWLTRKYGMTVDNLLSVKLVTVEGESITASENENPDLFWAVRGGGGNFGVITEFEYALHSVGPEVLAGLIVYPLAQARQVLNSYREFNLQASQDLSVWCVMRQAPPLPFLPENVHGQEIVILAFMYAGEPTEGKKQISSLPSFGDPLGEHIGVMPYIQWQQGFDALLTPGARNYWKSHNFTELKDETLDIMIEYTGKLPSPQCEIFVAHIAGAPNRVPSAAMAYGGRKTQYVMNVHARWDENSDDDSCIDWARKFFNATKPFASAGAYVNFMTAEEDDRVTYAYGSNYKKLVEVKRKYDPDNILHMNQNIKP